ncbi:hypothetical protein [Mucilaginibacter pedocola]|uniref:Uncharacterized protein n=1 Tax=Mucilaginibacter pedocola TaxID=1792845 RepID=A0A1S9PEA9_9SPHI|nr:hypothetical protein [Mucilaginibacter pedocola]OOQ59280.1 hypothetical protein BC343_28595 [Mucilaginibacter pedocola]
MGDIFEIWWRGLSIGTFEVITIDMWYRDGIFRPDNSPKALQFETIVNSFKIAEVTKDPTKGTRILLRSNVTEINALVIALENATLSVRLIMDEKAIKWLIDNVH